MMLIIEKEVKKVTIGPWRAGTPVSSVKGKTTTSAGEKRVVQGDNLGPDFLLRDTIVKIIVEPGILNLHFIQIIRAFICPLARILFCIPLQMVFVTIA